MKFTLVCLFAISAFVYVYGQEYYSDKFDNIDVDQILNNDRLLKRYIDCMLDKPNVRCPSEALDIKREYYTPIIYENYNYTERIAKLYNVACLETMYPFH